MKKFSVYITKMSGEGMSGMQMEGETAKEAAEKVLALYKEGTLYEIQTFEIYNPETYHWVHDKK